MLSFSLCGQSKKEGSSGVWGDGGLEDRVFAEAPLHTCWLQRIEQGRPHALGILMFRYSWHCKGGGRSGIGAQRGRGGEGGKGSC